MSLAKSWHAWLVDMLKCGASPAVTCSCSAFISLEVSSLGGRRDLEVQIFVFKIL